MIGVGQILRNLDSKGWTLMPVSEQRSDKIKIMVESIIL